MSSEEFINILFCMFITALFIFILGWLVLELIDYARSSSYYSKEMRRLSNECRELINKL